MKKLHEIKNEYAGEQGRDSWDEFFEYCELTHTPLERMQYHHDEIAKRFALEVAKVSLRNAAENATITGHWDSEIGDVIHSVNKDSILSHDNIPKL
ncbi:hypothetical protein ACR79K_27170 [Sphingobacterium siyangense]|uniref:hypothetical protein n=1 Tax=Sphingobacterium siyangense TaxID=459529 RepID=UPI003DA1F442